MEFKFKILARMLMPTLVAMAMAACGSDDSSTTTTDDPVASLPSVSTPTEAVTAGDNQLVINVVDTSQLASSASSKSSKSVSSDISYAAWNLYLWNDSSCSALDASGTTPVVGSWSDTSNIPTGEDSYGPYWSLPLSSTTGCVNFILRNGSDKLIDADMKVDLSTFTDRTVSVVVGKSTVYDTRAEAFYAAFGVAQATAHLVAGDTLLWPDGADQDIVRLYYSTSGGIGPDETDGTFKDSYVNLTATTLSDELKAKYPHLAGYAAFKVPSTVDIKTLLKGELVAIATNSSGIVQAATQVQTAGALDDEYASAAKTLDYGAIVADDAVTFRLWAPTAQNVQLVIYNDDKSVAATQQMTFDSDSGAWSYAGSSDLKGKYYRYALQVYHPVNRTVNSYEVTDPYSLSLSQNSEYSQVIDLDDASLKPDGWDALTAPHAQATKSDLAKMVITESHVRDLSAWDTTVTHQGKYLALTETGSNVVKHLKELASDGVTHIELMPVFDIASVDEDSSKVVNLTDAFSKLCSTNSAVAADSHFASYCDGNETIASVLTTLQASDNSSTPLVQSLYGYLRDYDSFNWGYDPFHYTTPEGSYASNPDDTSRILEFRKMIQSIKQNIGMNVIMDVVYNHTNAAGPTATSSVLDKIVPWYYQRLNETTGSVESATCCSDSAPEHTMFAKLMVDSLKTWTDAYKIDAFRFDLMGYIPKAVMVDALAEVKKIDANMYFLGEGWDAGQSDRFTMASQLNLGGEGIGTFSDRLRDAVRGGGPFDSGDSIRNNQGFGNGAYVAPNEKDAITLDSALHQSDLTMLGMAGNLSAFVLQTKDDIPQAGADILYGTAAAGYATDPIEVQNYVSKHDNQTIWDIINYKAAKDVDLATRVKMQAISEATVLLGQGIAFDQQGSDLLRSKSYERDSYNSGDWYNKVDYSYQDNNYDKGMPRQDKDGDNYSLIEEVKSYGANVGSTEIAQMRSFYKELLQLRQASPLMTLGAGSEVINRVDFRNTGSEQTPGLIVMTIDNGTGQASDLDSSSDGLVIIVNATADSQSTGTFTDGSGNALTLSGFELSSVQTALGSASLGYGASFADGKFTVPAWSVAVFSKVRSGDRSVGLPVSKKQDMSTVAPFGDTALYLKGLYGSHWTAEDAMAFTSNYQYEFDVTVTAADLTSAGVTELFPYGVKVATTDWSTYNFGKCSDDDTALAVGTAVTLCNSASDNVTFSATAAGTYHFTLTAKDKTNPTLKVTYSEPAAACELLADSSETPTLGAETLLALRGNHSSWNWDAQYQLTYKGSGIYEAKISGVDLTGGFKIAANTTAWDPQFIANADDALVTDMQPDVVYDAFARFASAGSDPGNNTMTLGDGNWLFRLKLDTSAEMSGSGVKGTIDVCALPSD